MAKFLVILIVWAVALVPTWIYLGVKFLMSPEGFWQNLILLILGLYFLGFCQVVLGFFGVIVTFKALTDRSL